MFSCMLMCAHAHLHAYLHAHVHMVIYMHAHLFCMLITLEWKVRLGGFLDIYWSVPSLYELPRPPQVLGWSTQLII